MGLFRKKKKNMTPEEKRQEADRAFEKSNYEKSLNLFKELAEEGDAYSQWMCGHIIGCGRGCERNWKESLRYYAMAAEQGHKKALQWYVEYCDEKGTEKDIEHLEKAYYFAKKGIELNMSGMYSHSVSLGSELEKEKKYLAYREIEKAADAGDPKAQYECGLHWEMGDVPGHSYKEALRYYTKAAEAGYPEAQYKAAVYWYYGIDMLSSEKDKNKAYEYLDKALASGEPCIEQERLLQLKLFGSYIKQGVLLERMIAERKQEEEAENILPKAMEAYEAGSYDVALPMLVKVAEYNHLKPGEYHFRYGERHEGRECPEDMLGENVDSMCAKMYLLGQGTDVDKYEALSHYLWEYRMELQCDGIPECFKETLNGKKQDISEKELDVMLLRLGIVLYNQKFYEDAFVILEKEGALENGYIQAALHQAAIYKHGIRGIVEKNENMAEVCFQMFLRNIEPGNSVLLGSVFRWIEFDKFHHKQFYDEVFWTVLEKRSDRVLLLCDKALDWCSGYGRFSGATRGTYFSNIDLELVDGEMFPLTSEQFEKYIVEKKIASMYPEISTGVRVQAIRRLDSLCSELQMEETEDGVKYSLKGIENLKQEEKIRRIVEKINYYSRDWALSDGFVSGGKVNTEEEKGKPEFLWIRPAVWLKLNVQDK